MMVRVERITSEGTDFVGQFGTEHELPIAGDIFWYGTHGPYTVVSRSFLFKDSDLDDRVDDVILTVKEISKHIPSA